MQLVDFVSNVAPIFKKVEYCHILRVPCGYLNRIGIKFATYSRSNSCSIQVSIHLSDNQLVWCNQINATNLMDNERYWINTGSLFAEDKLFKIWLKSDDAGVDNHVAVWLQIRNKYGLVQKTTRFLGLKSSTIHFSGYGLDIAHDDFGLYYESHSLDIKRADDKSKSFSIIVNNDRKLAERFFNDFESCFQVFFISGPIDFPKLLAIKPSLIFLEQAVEDSVFEELVKNARFINSALIWVDKHGSTEAADFYTRWNRYFFSFVEYNVLLDQSRFTDLCVNKTITQYSSSVCPAVSFVLALERLSGCEERVLQSIVTQSYSGRIELIVVTPTKAEVVSPISILFQETIASLSLSERFSLQLLTDDSGSVFSMWRKATTAASGDIVFLSHFETLFSFDLVQIHIDAYSFQDCAAVNGGLVPMNDAAGNSLTEQWLSLDITQNKLLLNDSLNPESFLNCLSGTISANKRSLLKVFEAIDFDFAVESADYVAIIIAYELYCAGERIKFCPQAVAKREVEQPFFCSDLFAQLERYEDALRFLIRRLSGDRKMHTVTGKSVQKSEKPRIKVFDKKSARTLRILTYRWHVAHQYELYKLPYEFYLVKGVGTPICDYWDFDQRPLPANAHFIDWEDVVVDEYDLAILHFDENVLAYQNTNGYLGAEWGANFRWFVEQVDLPKIAVCHGTPQFYGQYTPGYSADDLMQVIEPSRCELVEYVKNIEIVCNSYQAQREWMFERSRVIWHGLDPTEFSPTTYREGILSPLGASVTSRPHYRGYYLWQQVFDQSFPEQFSPKTLNVPKPHVEYRDNVYAYAKFRNYVDQLRRFSIYFNPTLRSPMPRARAEPMMCGLVTVNALNHDVDLFIKNGVNGFYSNDADELRDFLLYLMSNKNECVRIGKEARLKAIDVFNHDRYLSDWKILIRHTIGDC